MKKYKRKIQLIAGTSYSISLPKEWVKNLNLLKNQELYLTEHDDLSLSVSPNFSNLSKDILNFDISKNVFDLKQILVSAYYYGYEEINFFSNFEISKEEKKKIREAVISLPGVEIIYEDKKSIKLKVVFMEMNFNLLQIFYRISLLISSSIENIIGNYDWEEIKLNENEVDRLYNFSIKIINSAMSNREILLSSKIENIRIVPSFFLIAKKLENIADSIKKIARIIEKDKSSLQNCNNFLVLFQEELNEVISYLLKEKHTDFKICSDFEGQFKDKISKIKNNFIQLHLENLLRYLFDIEKEITSIIFYRKIND